MTSSKYFDAVAFVADSFAGAGIATSSIEVRDFPEESIVVVAVAPDRVTDAIDLANELDQQLVSRGFDGFVTVRKSTASTAESDQDGPVKTLADQRVLALVNLLTARSRTSEIQPSLSYIADVENNIAIVTGARHHLIFGRRGAGKTALMAEAKRLVEECDHVTVWCNIQTFRHESSARMLLLLASRLCEMVQAQFRLAKKLPKVALSAIELNERVRMLLGDKEADVTRVQRLLPDVQKMMRQCLQLLEVRAYIFLDDFHYLQ